MSTGKILLGILAGAAAGATIAILFAPDKGSNTRKKIASKTTDLKDELVDKFNGYVQGMTNHVESAANGVNKIVEKGKTTMEEADRKFTGYTK